MKLQHWFWWWWWFLFAIKVGSGVKCQWKWTTIDCGCVQSTFGEWLPNCVWSIWQLHLQFVKTSAAMNNLKRFQFVAKVMRDGGGRRGASIVGVENNPLFQHWTLYIQMDVRVSIGSCESREKFNWPNAKEGELLFFHYGYSFEEFPFSLPCGPNHWRII